MLRIHLEGEPPRRLRLEGRLATATLEEFERACRQVPGGPLEIDLAGLTFADAAAVAALRRQQERGARLRGGSAFLHELFKENPS